jgi:hypothetical protein
VKVYEDQLVSQNSQVVTDLDELKHEFEVSKQRFEETVMTKKTYNHILNRLKVPLMMR